MTFPHPNHEELPDMTDAGNRFERFIEHPTVNAVLGFGGIVLVIAMLGGRYFL